MEAATSASASTQKPGSTLQGSIVNDFLTEHPSVTFIKFFWTSYSGLLYSRTVTAARSQTLFITNLPLRVHATCIAGLAPVLSLDPIYASPIGRTALWPAWESVRLINSSHAMVQCIVAEDLDLYPALQLPDPTTRCPRSCLQRVLGFAQKQYDLEFLAGFELEFYLIPNNGKVVLMPETRSLWPWSSAASMRGGPYSRCIEACMLALENAGIVVEQAHSECGLHQFEIVTGPLPVMKAVDSLYCAREVISDIAAGMDFEVDWRPMPSEAREPTGLHFHLSIHESGTRNGMSSGLVERAESDKFLAGMLRRFAALCAFGMPSQESYKRSEKPAILGRYVAWGKNNSSVPISEVTTGYWEIRSLDWTANIYLAVAAYISAGVLGLEKREQLMTEDPGELTHRMDAEALKQKGITKLIPPSQQEAMINLIEERYAGLQDLMGEEVMDLYVVIKKKEQEFLLAMTEENREAMFKLHFTHKS